MEIFSHVLCFLVLKENQTLTLSHKKLGAHNEKCSLDYIFTLIDVRLQPLNNCCYHNYVSVKLQNHACSISSCNSSLQMFEYTNMNFEI